MKSSGETTDFRWYYIDDSGAPQTGWIIYGYLEIGSTNWNMALQHWLSFRKELYQTAQIPADYELHSRDFINGRGNPSLDETWNRRKAMRHQTACDALRCIAAMPGIRLGAVYRYTLARRNAYAEQSRQVYGRLIDCLTARLAAADEYGTIVIDGDGTDPSYRHQHRELKLMDRRIIEDPLFQGAHASQFVQIADLVAYTSYQAVYCDPARHFMHDWFNRYLSPVGELTEV